MKTIILLTVAALLTSCTLEVAPDGTRKWGTDPVAARAIIMDYAK